MPIDIRLLRTPDDAARVSHWQRLRHLDQDDNTCQSLVVQQLDQTNRQALKMLNSYKAQCRRERQRPDPERLQSYQQDCLVCQQELEQELWRLGNAVDETLLTDMEEWDSTALTADNSDTKKGNHSLLRSPFRHLLELEAFECGNNNALQLQSGLFYPTGIGMDWARALSCHFLATVTTTGKDTRRLELPASLPLSAQHLHDMMGCTKTKNQVQISGNDDDESSCPICAATTTKTNHGAAPSEPELDMLLQAPSWMGYLKDRYGDQTLGDKQLPLTFCYQTKTAAVSDLLVDAREQWRCDSWHSLLPSMMPSSSATINYRVLILTSATYYDSRTVQKEWADKMLSFYTSLLLLPSSSSSSRTLVRQRVVSPPRLLPAEASRIVIEGYLPASSSSSSGINVEDNSSSNSTNDEGRWVILAYLSNFSDYPTRACRIKNNPQQFCHVLQGVICSSLEVMCWQASLAANGNENESNSEFGVRLPAALASHFPSNGPHYERTTEEDDGSLFLPRTKVFEKTKHGRLQLKPARRSSGKKPQAPRIAVVGTTAATQSQTATKMPKEDSDDGRLPPTKDPQRAPLLNTNAAVLSSSLSARDTTERVRAEALSSPFGFLPFYNS